jgi:hypothetical protein
MPRMIRMTRCPQSEQPPLPPTPSRAAMAGAEQLPPSGCLPEWSWPPWPAARPRSAHLQRPVQSTRPSTRPRPRARKTDAVIPSRLPPWPVPPCIKRAHGIRAPEACLYTSATLLFRSPSRASCCFAAPPSCRGESMTTRFRPYRGLGEGAIDRWRQLSIRPGKADWPDKRVTEYRAESRRSGSAPYVAPR